MTCSGKCFICDPLVCICFWLNRMGGTTVAGPVVISTLIMCTISWGDFPCVKMMFLHNTMWKRSIIGLATVLEQRATVPHFTFSPQLEKEQCKVCVVIMFGSSVIKYNIVLKSNKMLLFNCPTTWDTYFCLIFSFRLPLELICEIYQYESRIAILF